MELKENFMMSVAAPRGRGKTYLISRLVMSMIDEFDFVYILCPSIKFNHDYDDFKDMEKVTLVTNVTQKFIEKLVKAQSDAKERCKEAEENPDVDVQLTCPKTLIVLDDCIDSGVLRFGSIIDMIAERGRHVDMTVMINAQRISAISRSVRINSDYFLLFSPFSISELEKFLEEFVSRSDRKILRLKLHEVFDLDHEFIIVDNVTLKLTEKIKHSNTDRFLKGDVDIMYISPASDKALLANEAMGKRSREETPVPKPITKKRKKS